MRYIWLPSTRSLSLSLSLSLSQYLRQRALVRSHTLSIQNDLDVDGAVDGDEDSASDEDTEHRHQRDEEVARMAIRARDSLFGSDTTNNGSDGDDDDEVGSLSCHSGLSEASLARRRKLRRVSDNRKRQLSADKKLVDSSLRRRKVAATALATHSRKPSNGQLAGAVNQVARTIGSLANRGKSEGAEMVEMVKLVTQAQLEMQTKMLEKIREDRKEMREDRKAMMGILNKVVEKLG
eukprot:TRINITY_DN4861_c0_g1_i1.p1 TRINITY_DN4861_c0_g1~~TRINITY_DN4861_c0_g1_i1.p1  ORF type:complete len:236 (-),score=43.14 TRINITY_DN4861_c0_g1_i1:199-906(-)